MSLYLYMYRYIILAYLYISIYTDTFTQGNLRRTSAYGGGGALGRSTTKVANVKQGPLLAVRNQLTGPRLSQHQEEKTMCAHMYIYIYVCKYRCACMYVYIYIHIYTYMLVHTAIAATSDAF